MECEFCVGGMRLKPILEFKYLRCVLDESETDEAECRRKVKCDRGLYVLLGLVNGSCLELECAMVLHGSFLVSVLMYCSEIVIWKEKERSKIRTGQIDNLRGLLGIRRMDKVPKARIRELCGVMKGWMKVFSDGSAMWRE